MKLRRKLSSWWLFVLCPAALGQTLLIRDVRVFDGEHVLQHRDVLLRDGKVDLITGHRLRAYGARIVDGRGRTLLPGLFDAHVHVLDEPEVPLRQLAGFGITTAFDMFSGETEMAAQKRVEIDDPPDMADIRGAGLGAIGPGSTLAKVAGGDLPYLSDPQQAQAWVDARISEGSDYIKVILDLREGGPLDQQTLEAIVRAAHLRGKRVVVHTLSEQTAREAIAAGADGLAHLFLGDSVSSDFGSFAAQHHIFVISTVITLDSLCGDPQGAALLADPRLRLFLPAVQQEESIKPVDAGRQHLCKAIPATISELMAAHVPILAGTDTSFGFVGKVLGVVAFGATLQVELKLLVDDGMTPTQALIAATSAPAQAFHLADRGWIRPGMRADLFLVKGDPTKDILATRNIVAVWKRGMRISVARISSREETESVPQIPNR